MSDGSAVPDEPVRRSGFGDLARQRGALGGFARAAKMTQAERSASASYAATIRHRRRQEAEAAERAARGHVEPPVDVLAADELVADPFLAEAIAAAPDLEPVAARRQAAILRSRYLARIDLDGSSR